MDKILTDQLDRIEASLTTLVDSIASYNPSISAAESLVQADDELKASLKQLQIHQRNEARIQSLREETNVQDTQIRSTLQQLADVRDELSTVTNSLPLEGKRDVQSEELLDFASRLSRYAIPPAVKSTAGQSPAIKDAELPSAIAESEGFGLGALIEEEKRWLDPWTGVQFTPWPGEDVIRSSALARLQAGEAGDIDLVKSEKDVGDGTSSPPTTGLEIHLGPTTGQQNQGAPRKKAEQAKVFGGLDLYDPELDD